MTARPPRLPANRSARRGVTLVEMLVTVGLLVLVMTILVQIFQSATGALTAQRTFAGLDQDIRRADTFLRQDLAGTTARMTPPLDPADGLGYFTYAENALADLQGEDTDDTIAFTAKAPPGRPFTGTMMVASDQRNAAGVPTSYKRVPISSEFAEIIYFLRNGNLYRRVFLILPKELQGGVTAGHSLGATYGWGYNGGAVPGGLPAVQPGTGLYGMPIGWLGLNDISARPATYGPSLTPHLNTLGDLTNRENRAFNPRFANDYLGYDAAGNLVSLPDGIPDDLNGDGVPDYYPTMYPQLGALVGVNWVAGQLIPYAPSVGWNPHRLAFPYVYKGDFSRPDPATANYRRAHSLDPAVPATKTGRPAFGTYLDPPYNHAPLDLDDPLGMPTAGQTWWGFPTKKETMSPFWTDPVKRLNDPAGIPDTNPYQQAAGQITLLPPLSDTVPGTGMGQPLAAMGSALGDTSPAGSPTFTPANFSQPIEYFQALVEDDLILTGVRSFDIKAFDPSMEAYMDLGYMNMAAGTTPTVDVNLDGSPDYWTLRTFAHEGRIPPLTTDYRSDPQAPAQNPNLGDDDTSVVRLTRVWDTWSTDYSKTPTQLIGTPTASPVPAMVKPALPSYPAPYPIPLRGIQINVRVVDPGNGRIKQITIRQDFSSKL